MAEQESKRVPVKGIEGLSTVLWANFEILNTKFDGIADKIADIDEQCKSLNANYNKLEMSLTVLNEKVIKLEREHETRGAVLYSCRNELDNNKGKEDALDTFRKENRKLFFMSTGLIISIFSIVLAIIKL